MLISSLKFYKIFFNIKSKNKFIHIFSSIDCDSICATKIFLTICKESGIQYILQPVRGYFDLKIKLNKVRESVIEHEIKIFFINCMGTENVLDYIFGKENNIDEFDWPELRIIIVDYHKPIHLKNIHSQKVVLIVDTNEICKKEFVWPYLELYTEKFNSWLHSNFQDRPPEKRRKLNSETENRKLRDQEKYYYKKNYYGNCSSWFFYLMANSLNNRNNSILWCAILGITKMLVYRELDRESYNELIENCQEEILYQKKSIIESQIDFSQYLFLNKLFPSQILISNQLNNIQISNEIQLILLHHWSIFKSIYYSPHMASKYNFWKDNGTKRIEKILANILMPLKEAHQNWFSLDINLQENFYSQFEKISMESLGEELFFCSFTKQHGDFHKLRASDLIHALSALLQDERTAIGNNNENKLNMILEKNFKRSMDSLDSKHQYALKTGFELAKYMQKNIIEKAFEISKKKKIESCGPINYVTIDEKTRFYTPLLISRLSLLIQNFENQNKSKINRNKPLVCAVWNYKYDTYTICGLPKIKISHSLKKNPFGMLFQEASIIVCAKVQEITFETFLIEVQKDDWGKFLSQLFQIIMKRESLF